MSKAPNLDTTPPILDTFRTRFEHPPFLKALVNQGFSSVLDIWTSFWRNRYFFVFICRYFTPSISVFSIPIRRIALLAVQSGIPLFSISSSTIA